MKKFLSLILALLTVVSAIPIAAWAVDGAPVTNEKALSGSSYSWDGTVAESFSSGTGTESDPYIIKTTQEMALLAKKVNGGTNYYGKYFRLARSLTFNDEFFVYDPDTGLVEVSDGYNTAYLGTGRLGDDSGYNTLFDTTASVKGQWYAFDIADMSGNPILGEYSGDLYEWTAIGTQKKTFQGHFDGNGYSINSIYINKNSDGQGLFGYCKSGSLKNISVWESFICGNTDVGAVCGNINSSTDNLKNYSVVVGKKSVGGVCGYAEKNIVNSQNNGDVIGSSENTGGVVGFAYFAVVYNCTNVGDVWGNTRTAGISGNSDCSNVINCINFGYVTGGNKVGGISGEHDNRYVLSSTDKPTRTENCANFGSVWGKEHVGGICGYSGFDGYYSGADYGTMSNCYNAGYVIGTKLVGGLSGSGVEYNYSKSYNVGKIYGEQNVGSLIGSKGLGTVEKLYYLSGSAGYTSGIIQNGLGTSSKNSSAVDKNGYNGLTTLDMQIPESFEGFDFDTVWIIDENINNGFPIHRYHYEIIKNNLTFYKPKKLVYNAYECLDLTGMKVYYRLGNSYKNYNDYDCSIALDEPLAPGKHTAVITAMGKEFSFEITVGNYEVGEINVSGFDMPYVGVMPDTTAEVDHAECVVIDSVKWSDSKPFEAGNKYSVTVTFKTTELAVFKDKVTVFLFGERIEAFPDKDTGLISISYSFDDLKNFRLHVIDRKSGKAISGARVLLGEQEWLTDEYGDLIYGASSCEVSTLRIIAEGYPELFISDFEIGKEPDMYIQLDRSEFSVNQVKCNDVNVLSNLVNINRMALTLEAEIKVIATSNRKILRYEIIQDNKIIAVSTSGSFKIDNFSFMSGKDVTLRTHIDSGIAGETYVYDTELNILVYEYKFKFGADFEDMCPFLPYINFDFPDNNALLGEMNMKIPLSKDKKILYNFEMGNDKAVLSYGYGVDIIKDDKDEKLSIGEKIKKLKDGYLNDMLEGSKWSKDLDRSDSALAYVVFEYDESGITNVYGEVAIKFEYEYKGGKTFMIASMPIRIEVDFNASGELKLTNLDFDEEKMRLEWPELDFLISMEILPRLGLGCNFLSGGVYGKGNLELDLGVFPEKKIKRFMLSGEVGAYFKIKLFFMRYEYRKTFWSDSKEWELRPMLLSMYDISSYSEGDREYLLYRTDWMEKSELYGIESEVENQDEIMLQGSAYDGIAPVTVSCGETNMMLFVDDDGSEGLNYQHIYFSLYDAETGNWGRPQKLDDNKCSDIEFEVCTDGDRIFVIYTESGEINGAEGEYEDIASTFEIYVAEYCPEEQMFINRHNISNNESYDMMPQIFVGADSVWAVWVNNITNDIFAQNANNAIYCSTLKDGIWSEARALTALGAPVTSLDIGLIGEDTYIAAIRDVDSDLTTDTDRNLTLVSFDGDVREIYTEIRKNDNVVFATIDGDKVLLWCNDSRILYVDERLEPKSLLGEEIGNISSNFKAVGLGEDCFAILYTKNDSTVDEDGYTLYGSDIYGVFYKNGSFGSPIRFTHTASDRYIDAFDVLVCRGEIVIPYISTAVKLVGEELERSHDFMSMTVGLPYDISISDIYIRHESLIEGDSFLGKLEIANDSFTGIDSFIVCVSDENGNVVYEAKTVCHIPSGEKRIVDISFLKSCIREGVAYTVSIAAEINDFNKENNSAPLDLWITDLDVEAKYLQLADKGYIQYIVRNVGNVKTEGELVFIKKNEGDEVTLLALPIESLAAGDTFMGKVEIDDGFFTEDASSNIVDVLVKFEGDADEENDRTTVNIDSVKVNEAVRVEDVKALLPPALDKSSFEYDKYLGGDQKLFVTENDYVFVRVKNEGATWEYAKNCLTITEAYLQTLVVGEALIVLEFANADETMDLILSVTVFDSAPVIAPVEIEELYECEFDGTAAELGIDIIYSTPSLGEIKREYSIDGEQWIAGLPTLIGEYKIKLTFAADLENNYIETVVETVLRIEKRSRAISSPTNITNDGRNVYFGGSAPTIGESDGVILYGYSVQNDVSTVENWSEVGMLPTSDDSATYYIFSKIVDGKNHADAYSIGLKAQAHVHAYEADSFVGGDQLTHVMLCKRCGLEIIGLHSYDSEEDLKCNVCFQDKYHTGDLDGAEGVDANDAIYLLYNVFFGEEEYPIDQPCDFNGDMVTDANDAIYLLYYVFFGEEEYPLM